MSIEESLAELYRLAKERNIEAVLMESPSNNYRPAPPDGWFGMRSQSRRLFLKLNNGHIPGADEIVDRIKRGQFIEHPL